MLQRELRVNVSRQGKIFAFIFIFHNFHKNERRLINQNKLEETTKKRYSDLFRIFALRGSLFGEGKVSKVLKRIDYRNRASAIF